MKLSKIATLMNPLNLIGKVNELIDVARSPLKRSTDYVVGEIVHVYSLPSNLYLECIQAGKTSSFNVTIPTTKNTEITDGSVKWVVRDKNNLVKKTGDTMSGTLNVQNVAVGVSVQGATKGGYRDVEFKDVDNVRIGVIRGNNYNSDAIKHSIALNVIDSTNAVKGGITVNYNESTNELYATAPTVASVSDSSTKIATTAFVHNTCVDKSGDSMSGNLQLTNTTAETKVGVTSGSGTINVYSQSGTTGNRGLYVTNADGSKTASITFDQDGNINVSKTPDATDSSTKIATTAFVKTNIPASVGSATQPVYTDANGKITACTYTLAKSVPSNAVFTDSKIAAKGSATQPVYISSSNTATVCTMASASATGLAMISGQTLAQDGYVRFNNGFTINWGKQTDTTQTVTYKKAFTTVYGGIASCMGGNWCWVKDLNTTTITPSGSSKCYWIAWGIS